METRARYISVGIFVLALFTGTLLFILWMTKADFRDQRQNYLIYFMGSVAGLRVNDHVRFHGIPIGEVKEITVDPKNVERVIVQVAIDHDYLIRENAVASVEAQGLTGYAYVHVKGGTQDSPILRAPPGAGLPVIASKASSIEMLFGSLPNILEKIYELSDRFNRLLSDHNLEDLSRSVQNISEMTQKLASGSTSLDGLMHQARESLRTFQTTLKEVNHALEGSDLKVALKSASQAAQEIEAFLKENRPAVTQFTTVGLEDFTRLVGETRETVTTLNRVLQDLERNPGQFLSKNTSQGYHLHATP